MNGHTHALPRLLDLHPPRDDLGTDVRRGLSQSPRGLPCKYFYDEYGSKLFDRICELDDYYPTRTEIAILRENLGEIAQALGPRVLLVEFGSGSSLKTDLLLDRLEDPVGYVPIDISRSHLVNSAARLARRYPQLEILPVCADFTEPVPLPEPREPAERRVVFFPGSTIGNFGRDEAERVLSTMVEDCRSGDLLLIGVDLRKDPEVLRRAYNDSEGVTAAFNLNLLRRINRELGADFDLDGFEHEAVWDEGKGRIEMHLRSLREQTVTMDGQTFSFAPDETIFTESSHKYSVEEFQELASKVGYEPVRVWTDPRRWFSVQLFRER